jgi:ABC-type Mn2+/Zn2+ transport system ATPase subunit
LDRLKKEKVTVMVATHDLDQAESHFDRIMLLNHRIVAFGKPGAVMQTENLINAYGGRLRSTDNGNILAIDDCCDDEHD